MWIRSIFFSLACEPDLAYPYHPCSVIIFIEWGHVTFWGNSLPFSILVDLHGWIFYEPSPICTSNWIYEIQRTALIHLRARQSNRHYLNLIKANTYDVNYLFSKILFFTGDLLVCRYKDLLWRVIKTDLCCIHPSSCYSSSRSPV